MKMAPPKHLLYLPVVYGQWTISLFLLLVIGNLTLFSITLRDFFVLMWIPNFKKIFFRLEYNYISPLSFLPLNSPIHPCPVFFKFKTSFFTNCLLRAYILVYTYLYISKYIQLSWNNVTCMYGLWTDHLALGSN